ncbi:c-type cytochrome biogenesis protein CcsB [Aquabacterium sp.]|uniref:c-type cytochrome biogenesis protein CcsB n=1 Tax=Aquabacterium sp. TaxID=1872578 RepID=UPI0035B14ABB
MNTTTLAQPSAASGLLKLTQGRSAYDWLFAAAVLAGAGFAFSRYGAAMDVYELAILAGAMPVMIGLGWFWGSLRTLMLLVAGASLLSIALYSRKMDDFGVDLSQAEHVFWLKYLLSSQSAILWMCVLFWMSTLFYWIGFFSSNPQATMQRLGGRIAWAGVFMALTGTMVRWFESHQIGPDIGHIPVSNLYEVFVLFCWLTTLFYLYYEQHFVQRAASTRSLGAFVMLVVSAAVGFLLWYALARSADSIQPLVPALQSWWMKLHVPANFIGYGTFSLAAMVALAYLLKTATQRALVVGLIGAPATLTLILLAFWLLANVQPETVNGIKSAARMSGSLAVFFALCVAARKPLAERLPPVEVLDDVMYKAIAVGFAFFTIATILGALWAAEAWGGYWSWDPKETWALIVWLNYAAWLHMRLMKGLRGGAAAWWALVGLLVTTFAFLGVNMFLSGLHSYGQL